MYNEMNLINNFGIFNIIITLWKLIIEYKLNTFYEDI